MRNKLLVVVLFFCAHNLFAQYLNISEIDKSGDIRPLTKLRQTVDINSQLNIEINKTAINDTANLELASLGNKRVDSLIQVLKVYRNYLEKMRLTIDQYALVFQSEQELDVKSLTNALKERARAGQDIVRLFPPDSRFQKRREEELQFVEGKGSNERFRIIMRLLAEEMQHPEEVLRELRKEAGFYFQLAAWSVTNAGVKPIHLEGFDELPPGEFYKYDNNQLALSPNQLQNLDSLSSYFGDLKRSNIFGKLSGTMLDLLTKQIDIAGNTAKIDKVKASVESVETDSKPQKESALSRLDNLSNSWKALGETIQDIKTKYTANEGVSSVSSQTELLRGFTQDIQNVKKRLNDISNLAIAVVLPADETKFGFIGKNVADTLKKLSTTLSQVGENLVDYSRDAFQMSTFGRQINEGALEISEKVSKLALDKIPNSTMLDLLYTGKREPGDIVVVKAQLWVKDKKEPLKTETHSFPMMNALPFVHMNVAYSYALPVAQGSNFKGGPLVSSLYKFKSHNLAFRNFFDPGIGLFAASYDFDRNDTPEFAGGVVTSLFKDYLQVGWGFNFNAKSSFWFAGLRIPIPSAPISLMGQ